MIFFSRPLELDRAMSLIPFPPPLRPLNARHTQHSSPRLAWRNVYIYRDSFPTNRSSLSNRYSPLKSINRNKTQTDMLPLFFVGFTYLVAFLLGPSDFYFPLSLSSSSIWSSIWISPSSTSTSTFSTPTFSTPTFSTSTPPSLTIDPPVKYELVYHSFIREYYGVHIKYERVWKVVMTQPASVSWLFVEAPWSIVESSREIVEDHRACVHRNTTADVWGIKDDPYSGPKDVSDLRFAIHHPSVYDSPSIRI